MGQTYPPAPGSGAGSRLAPLLVFGLCLLATLWRFLPWMPSVFYGDDLDYLLLFKDGECASRAAQILTTICYERYRPVASAFVIAMINVFGDQRDYYLAVNVIVQGAIGVLVFVISRRLSRGNWLVAGMIAVAAVISRFGVYQVTQMIGPVESLTLALCLGMVYSAVRADEDPTKAWRWGWLAVSCSFLAMHSHERSMVAAVWLGLAFVLSPSIRSLPRRRWLALLAACLALPAYYIAFKTFVLEAHFLIGAGGTHLDLDLPLFFEHANQALRSVFGFNTGPDYLAGASVSTAWPAAWGLAAVLALAWLGLLADGVRTGVAKQPGAPDQALVRLRWPLLLPALSAALIFPALLTIRLEQRWLLAPFVVGLLVAAWASGAPGGNPRLRTLLVAALCIASIGVDSLIVRHYDRLYFVWSQRFAERVKEDIVDAYPRENGGVALAGAGAVQCSWTLSKGGFFRVYGGEGRAVKCFGSLQEAANAGLPADTRIYGRDAANRFKDITPKAVELVEPPAGRKIHDFLERFGTGRINDTRWVLTPTGQGVLAMPWDSTGGVTNTITVLSGFSYRFEGIDVPAGAELRFRAGMIHPSPQSARAVVRIGEGGGEPAVAWSKNLAPPSAEEKPQFLYSSLSLADHAGKRISVSFSVESPGGNPSAHWIGYAEPRIVLPLP